MLQRGGSLARLSLRSSDSRSDGVGVEGTPGMTRTCDPLLRSPFPANKQNDEFLKEYQAVGFKELASAYGRL